MIPGLSLVPASSGFAQAQKAKLGGAAVRHKTAPAMARPITPAKPVTQPPHQKSGAHPVPNSHQPAKTDEELVASLHSTMAQLDHDERGHHARALSEVNIAINLLGKTPGSAIPSTPPARRIKNSVATGIHLTEAQKMLQQVESQMSTNGIKAHQFIRARASIQTALRELNLALVDR